MKNIKVLEQVGIHQVPGWYHFKLVLFLWLQFPMLGGAEMVYNRCFAVLVRFGLMGRRDEGQKGGEEVEKGKGGGAGSARFWI